MRVSMDLPEILPHPDPERRTKIMRSMANTGYLNVWEGAVRSGKTVYALMSFLDYVLTSKGRTFLMSGRTMATIESNAILGDYGALNLLGLPSDSYRMVGKSKAIVIHVKQGVKVIRKLIRVFGAADIRAYMSIRGNTYDGWFADEINMHDPEFVVEAFKRTAASDDRRHFFSLNPAAPTDWFYREYLDVYDAYSPEKRKELGGYYWWHFTPHDNPIMTPEKIRAMELQYPPGSYLYDRYVLGKRCIAEGLVYPTVNDSHFTEFDVKDVDIRYCAVDFGTDHPTVAYFGGMFKGNRFDWRICAEYFDQGSDKTTYDHYCGLMDVCKNLGVDPHRVTYAVDPAAKVFRLELLKHGLNVVKAKNDVLDGIDYTRSVIYRGYLSFHSSLKGLRQQFGTYSWDPKASERGEDKPLKVDDDRVDAVRYFDYTHMKPIIGMVTL